MKCLEKKSKLSFLLDSSISSAMFLLEVGLPGIPVFDSVLQQERPKLTYRYQFFSGHARAPLINLG